MCHEMRGWGCRKPTNPMNMRRVTLRGRGRPEAISDERRRGQLPTPSTYNRVERPSSTLSTSGRPTRPPRWGRGRAQDGTHRCPQVALRVWSAGRGRRRSRIWRLRRSGLEIWADPSAYCIGATPDDDDATGTVLRCMLGDTDGLLPCPHDWR